MRKFDGAAFAARLRALREQSGLSQQALADAAGVNKFTVAKLERGLQSPQWCIVVDLAIAMGVLPNEFLSEEELRKISNPTPKTKRKDA